ncbi:MAG TPA: chloride channel protein, partial [Bacteroidia bacterium]|nr:chloride channel protein [Bacteroidia bacterium]
AGVLMAIELLLFEFSARSIIPVALACVAGDIMHIYFMGSGAIFAMPTVALPGTIAMFIYVIIGLLVGVLAVVSTKMLYYFEDLYSKIPIHWMWYPAIGGLVVGFIGYYFPDTLGVGYDNIRAVLSGSVTLETLIALCFFKLISWTIALSSNTSGGTLAPLFIIGGAAGALLGTAIIFLFPQIGLDVRLAALIGMAAIFSGASRALFTSIVFAVESTLQPNALLPLLGACTAAYIVSYLLMETTIMTEKVERRGVKVPTVYEYSFLVLLNVQKVMKKNCITFSSNNTLLEVREIIKRDRLHEIQTAFPVVDIDQKPIGIVTLQQIKNTSLTEDNSIQKIIQQKNIFITEDVFLQDAVNLMVENTVEILPVVSNNNDKKLVGIISYKTLMDAYALNSKEMLDRKQMLHFWKRKTKKV